MQLGWQLQKNCSKATQEAQPQPEQTQGNAGENVQDADFEEVK